MFVFFGKRTKYISEQARAVTIPQLIGFRYQDKNYQAFSGAVIMFFEMIYLVSVYVGLSKLLTLLTPSGSQSETDVAYMVGVSLCAIITIVYLVFGGSIGAILSDSVESMIMIAGVVLITIFGLASVGGLEGLMAGLAGAETIGSITNPGTLESFTIPFTTGSLTTFVGFGGMGLLGFILVTSFGQWGMPQSLSRFFTAKNKKALKYGLLVACVWASFVAFFAYFNGAVANAYWFLHAGDPTIDATIIAVFKDIDMNIPLFLRQVMPSALAAIFIAAVTAASMTTGEKLILISASGFSQDVYQNIKERGGEKISDVKMLRITKVSTIFVVIAALLLALTKPEFVLTLCMFAWSAMAATILVPFVFGLFWKRGTAKAAWVSGIIALSVAVAWWLIFRFSNPAIEAVFHDLRAIVLQTNPFAITLGDYFVAPGKMIKTGIHEFIVSQVVALISFPIVSLFTKAPDGQFVDSLFKGMKALRK